MADPGAGGGRPPDADPAGRRPPRARDVHRATTLALSAAMAGLGVAMLAVTLANGGGPFALGVLLGVLFVVAGGGRLWFTWRSE
jgi:hypothetical protein